MSVEKGSKKFKLNKKLVKNILGYPLLFLLLLIISLGISLKINFLGTATFITRVITKADFKIESIEKVGDSRIVLRGVKLDTNGENVLTTDEIILDYSLEDKKITKIFLDSPDVTIVREKNGDINVVEAFSPRWSKKDDDKDDKEEEEYLEPSGGSVPIDLIEIKGATGTYKDRSYDKEIVVDVDTLDGSVTFSKEKGVGVEVDGKKNGEDLYFSYKNETQKYNITIKTKNFKLSEPLLQYGYDDDTLEYIGGVADIDFNVASKGVVGRIDVRDLSINYSELTKGVTDIKGSAIFSGDDLQLDGTFNVDGRKGVIDLSVPFDTGYLDLNFSLEDINYGFLEMYKPLQEFDLQAKDLPISKINVGIYTDKDGIPKANIDLDVDRYDIAGGNIQDIHGRVKYIGDEFYYFSGFTGKVDFGTPPMGLKSDFQLDGKLSEKEGFFDLNYKLLNIEGSTGIKNLSGTAYLGMAKGDYKLTVGSSDIVFDVKYDKNASRLDISHDVGEKWSVNLGGSELIDRSDFNVVYDFKNGFIESGKGRIDVSYKGTSLSGIFNTSKDIVSLNDIEYKDHKGVLTGKVELNKKKRSYKVDFVGKNLDPSSYINNKNLDITLSLDGSIEGDKDGQRGVVNISNLDGYYGKAHLGNMSGEILINQNNYNGVYFVGAVEKLAYGKLAVYDYQVVANIKDNVMKLNDFSNNISGLVGTYDMSTGEVDFRYDIQELERTLKEGVELDVDSVSGTIKGVGSKVVIENNIGDVSFLLGEKETPIDLSGNITYHDREIEVSDFKVNQSVITGRYNTESKNYRVKARVFEPNLPDYYGDVNLKYRAIGEVDIRGGSERFKSNVKLNIDSVFLRGNKLPNLYLESRYDSSSLKELGVLAVDKLTLLTEDRDEIIRLNGSIDLGKKYIDLKNQGSDLDFNKLEYLLGGKKIKGSGRYNLMLKGPLGNLDYKFNLNSTDLDINQVDLDKVKIDLSGDSKKFNLNQSEFVYEGNTLTTTGWYNMTDGSYSFNTDSKEINLDFLNLFLGKYGIEDISGMSNFDLDIASTGNNGSLSVEKFNLNMPDKKLKLSDARGKIFLSGENIGIDHLIGTLNDGAVNINGNLEIPDVDEFKSSLNPINTLKYSLDIKLDKSRYEYTDDINGVFSADIKAKNGRVRGSVTINRVDITKIPEEDKGSKKEKEKRKKEIKKKIYDENIIAVSSELGEEFKIENPYATKIDVNIEFYVEDGIYIDIRQPFPLVSYVDLIVKGDGRIVYKDGRLQILGEIYTKRGELEVNNNVFTVDQGAVFFNNEDEYFPNINPVISFNASSIIEDKIVNIIVNGPLKDPEITLGSNVGISDQDLASLLAFQGTAENSDNQDDSQLVMKGVIDSQVSSQLFAPISNKFKDFFKLSKFKISSDLSDGRYVDGEYEEDSLGLGAKIEAEDPIYGEKLYWNALVRFADNESGGNLDEYDVGTAYKFTDNFSVGIGTGKLPEGMTDKNGDESTNLNYHIDFKFRKRYNNIMEIFFGE